MFLALKSLVPNADDLRAMEIEEVAGVLLQHLASYQGLRNNTVLQHGGISKHNFFQQPEGGGLGAGQMREYGDKQPQVAQAILEAWQWLVSETLLVERATSGGGGWYLLSRRGERLGASPEAFEAYRKASLLPKGHLHPEIASKVYAAFLRGEYDTAIFQAFREVEVAVREAGKFGPDDFGLLLMRAAFKPAERKGVSTTPGPLTDTSLPVAEQDAMANLFAGAIGLYKNPQSHRHVPTHGEDAAEVIVMASQLLRIVDRLKKP